MEDLKNTELKMNLEEITLQSNVKKDNIKTGLKVLQMLKYYKKFTSQNGGSYYE